MHFESNMYNTAHHLIGNTHHQCVCCMHVSFKSILITNVEETEHTVSEENQSRSAWWLKPQQHEEWLLIVRVNFATDKTMGWNPDAEKWWKQPHLQPTFLFKVDGQKLKGGDGIKDSCCYCCCSLHLPPLPIIKLDCHWSDPPTLYVAKTQLSVSWMPDRWSAHRHVLLHHQRTDKHWTPVGFFLVFFPPLSGLLHSTACKLHLPSTNHIFTCIPSQTGDKQHTSSNPQSSACWRGYDLHKLHYGWGWERAGACTVTANQHRHDLSAAVTRTNLQLPQLTGPLGPTAVWRYSPSEGRRSSRTSRLVMRKKNERMFPPPSHTGDAKHPAGLQRDPAKLRQGREKSEVTSARSVLQNKRQRVANNKSGWKRTAPCLMTGGHPLKYISRLKNTPYIFNKVEDNTFNPLLHALQAQFWSKPEAVLWRLKDTFTKLLTFGSEVVR